MSDNITFDAVVQSVKTLADGGLRISLDLPETAIEAATWLMEVKRSETPLRVACVVLGEIEQVT